MMPIRRGDGTGLSVPGFSEVRKGDGTVLWSAGGEIPDSVVWQIAGETYTTGDATWADQIGSNDVSITGDPQAETLGEGDAVRGDGVDDYGGGDAPTIETQTAYGIGFTFASTDSSVFAWGRNNAGADEFVLDFGGVTGSGAGEIGFRLRDSAGNVAEAHANVTVNDGNPHYIIINKPSDNPADWDFYLDQTASPVSKTVTSNEGYDSSNHSPRAELGVWARNNSGTPDDYADIAIGCLEFNNDTYPQSEREGFVARRPEV